jgi:DNA-binding NtrC family response regulator
MRKRNRQKLTVRLTALEIKKDRKEISRAATITDVPSAHMSLDEWLKLQEKQYLAQILDACRGNVGLTAQSCGIPVRTLFRKMRLYGLDKRAFKKNPATGRSSSISPAVQEGETKRREPHRSNHS